MNIDYTYLIDKIGKPLKNRVIIYDDILHIQTEWNENSKNICEWFREHDGKHYNKLHGKSGWTFPDPSISPKKKKTSLSINEEKVGYTTSLPSIKKKKNKSPNPFSCPITKINEDNQKEKKSPSPSNKYTCRKKDPQNKKYQRAQDYNDPQIENYDNLQIEDYNDLQIEGDEERDEYEQKEHQQEEEYDEEDEEQEQEEEYDEEDEEQEQEEEYDGEDEEREQEEEYDEEDEEQEREEEYDEEDEERENSSQYTRSSGSQSYGCFAIPSIQYKYDIPDYILKDIQIYLDLKREWNESFIDSAS
jgi:hypothetical protein